MNEAGDRAQPGDGARRLADAIREVKNAAADREDVVVDMREAQRMRLELIAAELAPVFAEVPADVDIFDFAISSGLQPRLWIDAVSHVAMGRDKRSYRFVRDTRMGRVVLAESHDMKPVADQVTLYIAERLIERQRQLDGGATPSVAMLARPPLRDLADQPARPAFAWRPVLSGIGLALAGAALGLVVTAALLWDRLVAMWSGQ
jgi:hypothetical protein